MTKKAKPRRKKPEKNLGGRPRIPDSLKRVSLTVRLPQRIKNGFIARAACRGRDRNGVPNSSVSLEVERAFEASATLGLAAPDEPLIS